MNQAIKAQLESAAITFGSTFLVTLGTQLQNLSFSSITTSVLIGIVIAAAQAGGRAIYNSLIASSTGNLLKTGKIVQ